MAFETSSNRLDPTQEKALRVSRRNQVTGMLRAAGIEFPPASAVLDELVMHYSALSAKRNEEGKGNPHREIKDHEIFSEAANKMGGIEALRKKLAQAQPDISA